MGSTTHGLKNSFIGMYGVFRFLIKLMLIYSNIRKAKNELS